MYKVHIFVFNAVRLQKSLTTGHSYLQYFHFRRYKTVVEFYGTRLLSRGEQRTLVQVKLY